MGPINGEVLSMAGFVAGGDSDSQIEKKEPNHGGGRRSWDESEWVESRMGAKDTVHRDAVQ